MKLLLTVLAVSLLTVTACAQPTITLQPTNELVPLGATAILSVTASSSSGPLTYQWQCDGTNFSPAIITTIAGNGTQGYSGDGGAATNASLNSPDALAVDSAGNVYFMDSGNCRVRKVDTNGIITTVAGNGTSGFSGDGGVATNASLSGPSIPAIISYYAMNYPGAGVAVDSAGNLFISDSGNLRVREVDTNGIIRTVAGNGSYGGPVWHTDYGGPGPTGDGNPATNAPFGQPFGLAVDATGRLFIADGPNSRVQCVDTNGVMTTAGASGSFASGIALDNLGNVFMAEYWMFGGGGIVEIFPNGLTTGLGGGISGCAGVAVDGAGKLFIANTGSAKILEANGINDTPWTVAGNGTNGYSGDGGAATNAELNNVYGVAVDSAGNLFIADAGNNVIRKVSGNPPRTTAPTLRLDNVSSANAGSYSVIITGAGGSITSSVATVTVGGPIISSPPHDCTAFVGGQAGFSVSAIGTPLSYQWLFNGAALGGQTNATLTFPAVTITNAGNYRVVVSNTYGSVTSSPPATLMVVVPTIGVITSQPTNQTVLAGSNVTFTVGVSGTGPFTFQWQRNGINLPQGIITTVAGNGTAGYSGDGGAATTAELNNPYDVAVDWAGNLFITDLSNYRIRKVNSSGVITTVAGTGASVGNITTHPNNGNGDWATNTPFAAPVGVAVNSKGWIYVPDNVAKRVQVITNGIMQTAATVNNPMGVMVDSADNLFIADAGTATVRKVTTNGVMTIVAGNGTGGFSGDGGAATNAELNGPQGMAEDSAGNLFIADSGNNRIRKVDTNGIITTVAGNGTGYFSADGVVATNSEISTPTGVTVDSVGNLLIADQGNNRIRAVDTNGIITTVVGRDLLGYSGDGGLATKATLNGPVNVSLDPWGNLYISDRNNNVVRKVLPMQGASLTLPAVAGTNAGNYQVIVTGPAGSVTSSVVALTVVYPPASQIVFSGQSTSFNVSVYSSAPTSYQWMFNGTNLPGETSAALTLPDVSTNSAGTYEVVVSNIYGSTTSSPPAMLIVAPTPGNEIAVPGGSVTFDLGNSLGGNCQYQWQHNGSVLPSGIITVAGKGNVGGGGDGGAATNALLASPRSVTMDHAGNLFIADYWNSVVRQVSTNGTITVAAGLATYNIWDGQTHWGYSGDGGPATSAKLDAPEGVAVDVLGDLFIADSANNCIRKVSAYGIITTVAGNTAVGFAGDGGLATNAVLAQPTDVAVDSAGNLFIADYWNSLIRKVDTNGIITTFAGLVTNGSIQWGYSGDGGAATNAELDAPISVAVDAAGNLLIADSVNNRIRKVDTNGIITTVAGVGWAGYTGDGGAATNAALNNPTGVAAGAAGDFFIADSGNQRIRKVDFNGIITTVAGNGTSGYSGDGGAATNAALNTPAGIVVDTHDYVFVADSGNNRIREVFPTRGATCELNNLSSNDAGAYQVIVTGSFGSLTSSIVNLMVIDAPLINQSTMNANKSFTLGFMSKSGSPSVVFCATNLSSPMVWYPIYTNYTGGAWQFTDTNTGSISSKYYRLLTP